MVEVAAFGSDDALIASARTDDRLGSHDLTTGPALFESGQEIKLKIYKSKSGRAVVL